MKGGGIIYSLVIAVMLFLSGGCSRERAIPTGEWVSLQGRAMVHIKEVAENEYSAIVFHSTYNGKVCPIEYPLMVGSSGMYIQAEGRIIVSYSAEKDQLFLSPGGIYIRKGVKHPESP